MEDQEKCKLILKQCLKFKNFKMRFLPIFEMLTDEYKKIACQLNDCSYSWVVKKGENCSQGFKGKFCIKSNKKAIVINYENIVPHQFYDKLTCQINNFNKSLINRSDSLENALNNPVLVCKYQDKTDPINNRIFTFSIQRKGSKYFLICRIEVYNYDLEPRYIDQAMEIDINVMAELFNSQCSV